MTMGSAERHEEILKDVIEQKIYKLHCYDSVVLSVPLFVLKISCQSKIVSKRKGTLLSVLFSPKLTSWV